jgi:hypothetical protein
MQFVYKTWPPKTEGPTEPPTDPEDPKTLSKKHLLKVIQRYHGDKNMTWGDEWRVLSEEVSDSVQLVCVVIQRPTDFQVLHSPV